MSKQPPPAPTASAVGPCPTVIQNVGRPGTGSLPSTIAPPDHPLLVWRSLVNMHQKLVDWSYQEQFHINVLTNFIFSFRTRLYSTYRKTSGQTVQIQKRWLIMSHLNRINAVCKSSFFFFYFIIVLFVCFRFRRFEI